MSLGFTVLLRYTGVTQVTAMLDQQGNVHCAQYFDDRSILFWWQPAGQEAFKMLSVFGDHGSRAQRIFSPTLHTKKADADAALHPAHQFPTQKGETYE